MTNPYPSQVQAQARKQQAKESQGANLQSLVWILFVAAVVLAFFFSIEAGIFTILLAILVELRHLATILVKKT